eukprot:CAMPEP_0178410940 /NCGR_PEP_ID=MMETSP0689_2-20121128/21241_1 /TAXON_ID=160604 /ORGANISM="Amphidinium massartii, Strain CS-259" /LENGTH=390 /DNA_ID=CAMNT_0020032137 /DNA_START=64 /DNA_END=1236 /DNA_ORIENTATION=+
MTSQAALKGLSPDSRARKLKEAAKAAEVHGSWVRVKAVLEKKMDIAPDVEKYMVEELGLDVRGIANAKTKKVAAPKPKAVFRTWGGVEEATEDAKTGEGGKVVINEITDTTAFQKNITQMEHVPVYITKYVLSCLHPSVCSAANIRALGRKKHDKLWSEVFTFLTDVEGGQPIPLDCRNPAACAAHMVEEGLSSKPLPSARALMLRSEIDWSSEGVYSLEWEDGKVFVQSVLTKETREVVFKQPVSEEEFDSLTITSNFSRYGAAVFGLGQSIKIVSILGETPRCVVGSKKRPAGLFNPNEQQDGGKQRRKKGGSSKAEVENLLLAQAKELGSGGSPAEKDKTVVDNTSPGASSSHEGAPSTIEDSQPAEPVDPDVDAEDAFAPPAASAS